MEWLTGVCALLAGVMPAIYKALDLDVSLSTLAKHAGEFKILQDRFRQAWRVTALGGYDAFKTEFDTLMQRPGRKAEDRRPQDAGYEWEQDHGAADGDHRQSRLGSSAAAAAVATCRQ